MIGQRGVPALAGGIERAVEELGARLVERGHEVVVFCRPGYSKRGLRTWRGMELIEVPTVPSKHLEALVHSGLSAVRAAAMNFDVVHFHALGPGLFSPVSKWFGRTPVVQTVHGLDYQRVKWGGGAKKVLYLGGWLSAHVPNATIVVSNDLKRHYAEHWGRDTHEITNGVNAPAEVSIPQESDAALGLSAGRYILFVGRLTPEKAPDLLIRAFSRLHTDMKLAIVGGTSHTDGYVQHLHGLAALDSRVVMAGHVYGDALTQLYAQAALFVQPSVLEGLPLVMLEAASFGIPVVASDIAPHLQVIVTPGPGRRVFRSGDEDAFVHALGDALNALDAEKRGAALFRTEVLARHRWSTIAEQTEAVYEDVLKSRHFK